MLSVHVISDNTIFRQKKSTVAITKTLMILMVRLAISLILLPLKRMMSLMKRSIQQ
jgi:hypothetical protein